MSLPAGLVLATHNRGKIDEWRALIGPTDSARSLGLAEPEETETTYAGNARLKALAACVATGRPALAEDSGIELPGWQGAPGVHTARFVAGQGGWSQTMERALAELGQGAAITWPTALCLVWPDGRQLSSEARTEGTLSPARGTGPGVCPWFIPMQLSLTLAELGADWRRLNDQRASAWSELLHQLEGEPR